MQYFISITLGRLQHRRSFLEQIDQYEEILVILFVYCPQWPRLSIIKETKLKTALQVRFFRHSMQFAEIIKFIERIIIVLRQMKTLNFLQV